MVASGNAVLLIDSALADHDTKALVTQVHTQFPELAIIVAGRRDDEHELAPLVSEGVIFRFLHKPASAERIRNFVDATQRRTNGTDLAATLPPRHKNELFGGTAELPVLAPPFKLKLDDGFTRRWGRRSLLIIPVVLAAWGIMTWEPWNRNASDDATAPAAAPVAQTNDAEDARIQQMLDAAGLALSQGALIEPPGQNALELYRAVLARDPSNDLARRGIDSVADELIVQAERALMEQDVTRLASAVDAVRSVRPDHPRLPFFISQLEQERAIQGKAGQPVRAVDTIGRPIESPAAATSCLPSGCRPSCSSRTSACAATSSSARTARSATCSPPAGSNPPTRPCCRGRCARRPVPGQRAAGDPRQPSRRCEPLVPERDRARHRPHAARDHARRHRCGAHRQRAR